MIYKRLLSGFLACSFVLINSITAMEKEKEETKQQAEERIRKQSEESQRNQQALVPSSCQNSYQSTNFTSFDELENLVRIAFKEAMQFYSDFSNLEDSTDRFVTTINTLNEIINIFVSTQKSEIYINFSENEQLKIQNYLLAILTDILQITKEYTWQQYNEKRFDNVENNIEIILKTVENYVKINEELLFSDKLKDIYNELKAIKNMATVQLSKRYTKQSKQDYQTDDSIKIPEKYHDTQRFLILRTKLHFIFNEIKKTYAQFKQFEKNHSPTLLIPWLQQDSVPMGRYVPYNTIPAIYNDNLVIRDVTECTNQLCGLFVQLPDLIDELLRLNDCNTESLSLEILDQYHEFIRYLMGSQQHDTALLCCQVCMTFSWNTTSKLQEMINKILLIEERLTKR